MKRLEGIGGTDASCIMGAGFKSPYELWEQKTGRGKEFKTTEAMRWGTELESVIMTRYHEQTGFAVQTVDPIRNEKADWWVGSPDGIAFDKEGKSIGLEIKTARFKDEKWGEPGTDQIPPGYYIQCQWYMPLLGVDEFHVPVLFSGQDLEIYVVQKDEKALKNLYKKCKVFWEEYVQKDAPPPEMSVEERSRFLNIQYSDPDDAIKSLGDDKESQDALSNMESLVYVKKEIENLKKQQQDLENKIKQQIGSNKGIESPFFRASWGKLQTRKSFDQSLFKGMVADVLGAEKAQELINKCTKEGNPFRAFTFTERKREE